MWNELDRKGDVFKNSWSLQKKLNSKRFQNTAKIFKS